MNIETIKIIWIYLNNYDFTITKISNVFCGFVFSVSKYLWFNWNSNYDFSIWKKLFSEFFTEIQFSKTGFFKNNFFEIFSHFLLIKRPWNDHKILMWLKVTLSDVIVQFCHSFCHSWREIWIFISDILHVTEWINWKIISTKNGWSISGWDQLINQWHE